MLRAEGAFGHSIALGSSLAIAVAMTLGTTIKPWQKTVVLTVLCGAVVATFSRTGMITTALAVVISCFTQRDAMSRTYRRGLLFAFTIGATAAFVAVRDVFLDSGREASDSALYRGDLLDLITYMRPVGLTSNYHVSTTKEVSIGGFGSIDNELILFGLVYGWVPLVLVLVAIGGAVVRVLRRHATPPVVAIVAQIPAFVTVALITQYSSVVWFAVGMAVGTQTLRDVAASARRFVPSHEIPAAPPRRPGALVHNREVVP